jgi:hypothetical protein
MRMKLQALSPAMEHAKETDLGSQMPGITSNLDQRLCAGMKEQVVDEPLVLQCQRGQFPGQSEDGVDVVGGSSSRSRAWSQRRRALPWHLGQWRFLHEL